jgi:hypothetical protein
LFIIELLLVTTVVALATVLDYEGLNGDVFLGVGLIFVILALVVIPTPKKEDANEEQ